MHVLCVHGGAGFHYDSPESELAVKRALKLACKRGYDMLCRGESALKGVEEAITVLEDDPCLNAGYGSNLMIDGTVECDASIMGGEFGHFGSTGACSGIKNPIKVASAILAESKASTKSPLGRVHPVTLVSQGAHSFATHHTLETLPPSDLIAPNARKEWSYWKDKLQKDISSRREGLEDTVGAIAWDTSANLAAGVSSGGILLKPSGRLGEAAVFGAGCWADTEIACSVSGTGEQIILTSLARTMAMAVKASIEDADAVIRRVLVEEFYDQCRKRGDEEANAGLIILVKENTGSEENPSIKARLWCAFTTKSMAIGYNSSMNPKPKVTILRRPKDFPTDQCPLVIDSLPLTSF